MDIHFVSGDNCMTNEEKFKEVFGFKRSEHHSSKYWESEYELPHELTNIEKFKEVFKGLVVSLDAQKRLVIDDSNIPYNFWEKVYKKENIV